MTPLTSRTPLGNQLLRHKNYTTLTKEGQLHYHQAAEIPLVNGPLAEKNGPFDDNDYCDAILNGDFDTSNLAPVSEVCDIVSGMRYPDPNQPTPSFDSTITDDTFFKAVFNTPEHTSSSPSGQHYRLSNTLA